MYSADFQGEYIRKAITKAYEEMMETELTEEYSYMMKSLEELKKEKKNALSEEDFDDIEEMIQSKIMTTCLAMMPRKEHPLQNTKTVGNTTRNLLDRYKSFNSSRNL